LEHALEAAAGSPSATNWKSRRSGLRPTPFSWVGELIVNSAIRDHAARVGRITTRAAWDHASS